MGGSSASALSWLSLVLDSIPCWMHCVGWSHKCGIFMSLWWQCSLILVHTMLRGDYSVSHPKLPTLHPVTQTRKWIWSVRVYMHVSLWTNSLSKNTHKYNMPLILESGLWMGFFFIGMCAHIWQIPKPEQCASGQHWRHGVQQHPQIAGWVNSEAGLRDTTRKVCYWDTLEWSCMWRHDMSKNIYQKVKSGAAPIKSLPKKWKSPFRPSLWWINKAVKSTQWVWCINNFLHPFWHSYAINWPSHHMFTLEKLALRQSNKTEICFFSPTNRARIGWFGKFKWNQT